MIVLVCGMSGSGKSTLAGALVRHQRCLGRSFVWLDGDEMRSVFGAEDESDTYQVSGRRRNAERLWRMVRVLDRQGFDVVVSMQLIFDDIFARNRDWFSQYFEVYLEASLDLLSARDSKGVYGGLNSQVDSPVVGVHIPYVSPPCPDLTIDMDSDRRSPEEMASSVSRLIASGRER